MTHSTIFMITESGYPVSGSGGLEGQITTISKGLSQQGVTVKVIAPITDYAPRSRKDNYQGIEIYRIAYPRLPLIGGLYMLCSLAIYLISHRKEYDAIHCQGAHNIAAIGCLVGKALNKPVVVKLTGWWERQHGILKEDNINLHVRILQWAIKKATYYQTISTELASLLKKNFEESKIILLPNAVDTERFTANQHRKASKAASAYNFASIGLFTGRFVPEKGLETLVDAWVRAFSADDDAALLIVGDGILQLDLRRKIKAYGREHQIILPGPTDDVEQYLEIADYGLLTSLNEGLSNTLLEFAASGLPVIGSQISGNEDVIEHGKTGWLYSKDSTDELTQCLIELKNKDASALDKMGESGRTFITQYAGVSSVAKRLSKLYRVAEP